MSRGEDEYLFHVTAAKLPAPEKEYRFHPTRKWRFDFAWPEHMVAVEIEGGVYTSGRHTRGKGFENDAVKYGEAVILGWKVLRFSTGQVGSGLALEMTERLFEEVV